MFVPFNKDSVALHYLLYRLIQSCSLFVQHCLPGGRTVSQKIRTEGPSSNCHVGTFTWETEVNHDQFSWYATRGLSWQAKKRVTWNRSFWTVKGNASFNWTGNTLRSLTIASLPIFTGSSVLSFVCVYLTTLSRALNCETETFCSLVCLSVCLSTMKTKQVWVCGSVSQFRNTQSG